MKTALERYFFCAAPVVFETVSEAHSDVPSLTKQNVKRVRLSPRATSRGVRCKVHRFTPGFPRITKHYLSQTSCSSLNVFERH
jgi:hypothetical protein